MNYMLHYQRLILQAKSHSRNKDTGIYELHHILPKCLGGDDLVENLVLLTPREHFLAHLLLWKSDKNNYKLFAPLLFFRKNKHVKNSRTFQTLREEHVRQMKSNNPSLNLSEESSNRKKAKLSFYASNRPIETRYKISEANKGKQKRLGAVLDEATKNKISKSLKNYFSSNEISAETRSKISLANTGRKYPNNIKEKWSDAAKKRVKFKCPICNTDMLYDGGNFSLHMKRKHQWTSGQSTTFKKE